jgi:AcrR family transcriptional regulator
MSRARFDNLEPKRQQKLFESAADEFADRGYDGASLNRILEKSGMSKSSLYYYFDDKADLFTTLVERATAYLLREVGGFDIDKLTTDNYWSEIEALSRRSADVMSRNDWYLKLGRAFYRLRGDKRNLSHLAGFLDLSRRWVEAFVCKGQELGVVRTDLPDSLLIDSAMSLTEVLDRWGVDHWNDYDAAERMEILATQVGMLKRLFGKEAEQG